MIISRIEKVNKVKYKIYIEEEYQFILYQRDLYVYDLEEGNEIDDALYHRILTETVIRRGKQKAMDLLKLMDRTDFELRNKLSKAGYATPIVEHIMNYINGYKYINDARYAENYIRNYKEIKSKTILKMELKMKGVSRELIQEAFDAQYNEGEDDELAIKKLIAKKVRNLNDMTESDYKKVMNFLLRKGFSYDQIKRNLKVSYDDEL